MISKYEEEERAQAECECQEAEMEELQSKVKWIWTSGGLGRSILIIGLLVGAGLTHGTLSNILLGVGLLLMVFSFVKTGRNIIKHSRYNAKEDSRR